MSKKFIKSCGYINLAVGICNLIKANNLFVLIASLIAIFLGSFILGCFDD